MCLVFFSLVPQLNFSSSALGCILIDSFCQSPVMHIVCRGNQLYPDDILMHKQIIEREGEKTCHLNSNFYVIDLLDWLLLQEVDWFFFS